MKMPTHHLKKAEDQELMASTYSPEAAEKLQNLIEENTGIPVEIQEVEK